MVRVIGPSLSNAAAGGLGHVLAFASNKGRAYLKHTPRPADPKTQAQLPNRLMMRFLQGQWSSLTDAEKATWLLAAAEAQITPYLAYLKGNLQRWSRRERPSKTPTTQAALNTWDAATYSTGGTRCIDFALNTYNPTNAWGITLHRSVDIPDTPRDTEIIDILATPYLVLTAKTLHEQPPGDWFYLALGFDAWGNSIPENFTGDSITVLP